MEPVRDGGDRAADSGEPLLRGEDLGGRDAAALGAEVMLGLAWTGGAPCPPLLLEVDMDLGGRPAYRSGLLMRSFGEFVSPARAVAVGGGGAMTDVIVQWVCG